MKLFAELPPYVYEELQKKAPESLLMKVDDVAIKPSVFAYTRVNVVAHVLAVSRSNSRLKKNDKITIIYTTFTSRPKGWVGPSPVPILEKDKTYRAFLTKSEEGNIYVPAAKGQSFIGK